MNGVLRSVWKGGMLRGFLGLVGGEIFIVGLWLWISINISTSIEDFFWGFEASIFLGQILVVLPGTVLGVALGLILGLVYRYIPVESSHRTKIAISIFVSSLLHLAILIFYINYPRLLDMGHICLLDSYFDYWVFIWLLYLAAAVWFGVNFHRKSVWTPRIFLKGAAS